MWYAALLRFIRRRLVLGIIFASSLTYCIVSFLKEGNNRNMVYQDISIERKPFVWRVLQEHNETNDSLCRNSIQGKNLIVDDRVAQVLRWKIETYLECQHHYLSLWLRRSREEKKLLKMTQKNRYVCQRSDLAKNGCCDTDSHHTKRYSCNTCKSNDCCVMYEYCVSCCLDPHKRTLLELVLSKLSAEEKVLFHSITDDYELCLTKCRTSSHSVLHENAYKDDDHKHCFGSGIAFRPPD